MAIADEIYDPNPKYTSPGLHKAAAEGGPQGVNTPVTTTIRSQVQPGMTADPIPAPSPEISLAKPPVPTAGVEADKPKTETISLQKPAVTEQVEFSPPTSVATDTEKPKTTAKTKTQEVKDKSIDMLDGFLTTIKNMAEGGDPAVHAEFNSWLNKFSLSNASERSALMMNLRSQPGFVAGSGEGTAALLMMSRGTNTTMADMMSKMSIANIKFMQDANKLGIEKTIQINQFLNEQETHELNNKISELNIEQGKLNLRTSEANLEQTELETLKSFGQYDQIAQILNKKYPGLSVSAASIRSADPATINAMASQKDSIAALVESGQGDAAKLQAVSYYGQFWQNEGFKSQEEAIAFANKLDFSAAAFKARSAFIESASASVRNYAVRNDTTAGKAAVVEYYKAVGRDPSSVGATLTPEQVTEMRKFFDPAAPAVTDLTAEDKKQLGIDWEWYQQNKAAAGANTIGAVYTSFAEAAKSAGTPFDADQERMVKAWINSNMLPGATTPTDGSPPLPWNDPSKSFYFTTWPKYDFSTETPTQLDEGGQRYSSLNGGNYGANTAAEDKRLDDAYLQFLHNPAHDKTMTRESWYFASKGGTVDISKTTPPGPASTKEGVEEFDRLVATKAGFGDALQAETAMTPIKTDILRYASMPPHTMTALSGPGSMYDEAARRLKNLGVKNIGSVFDMDSYSSGSNKYTGTPTFAYYAAYIRLLRNLNPEDAKAALVAMVGQAQADSALALERGGSVTIAGGV